jgi:hypothetical protein
VLCNYEDKIFRYPDSVDGFGQYPFQGNIHGC